MYKRQKLTRKSSRKIFKRGAIRIHKKNFTSTIRRGGIRL